MSAVTELGGVSASLSSKSQLREAELGAEVNGQESLPFKLTGSQRKTVQALRQNAAWMIEEVGLECVVFSTLTIGERDQWGDWLKVHEASEAGRRLNNLARHVLKAIFERYIVVSERHKDGGIHYHLLGVLRGRPDVRTGYDFRAAADGDYSSASEALRGVWSALRDDGVKALGFGRCETEPIISCGQAVAKYVSKYIEKNICNRMVADKGKKLVRYHGFASASEIIVRPDGTRGHLRPIDFGWSTPAACQWRRQAMAIASTRGLSRDTIAANVGSRWAYRLTKIMHETGLDDAGGDEAWNWTNEQRELAGEFLRRDMRDRDGWLIEQSSAEKQKVAWERALTAEEIEALDVDLGRHRAIADELAEMDAELCPSRTAPVFRPECVRAPLPLFDFAASVACNQDQ
jgi:hypothetical protein